MCLNWAMNAFMRDAPRTLLATLVVLSTDIRLMPDNRRRLLYFLSRRAGGHVTTVCYMNGSLVAAGHMTCGYISWWADHFAPNDRSSERVSLGFTVISRTCAPRIGCHALIRYVPAGRSLMLKEPLRFVTA